MINECPVPNGKLVIIGGKENKGEKSSSSLDLPEHVHPLAILQKFVSLAKKKHPVIEVITSASGEPEALFEDYRKAFEQLEVTVVGHIHHANRKEVTCDVLEERINKADAVFFAGGNQLKYTSWYGGTALLTRLKERYIYDKLILGGSSAGAMALSTPMIYAGNNHVQELAGETKVTTGLEFLKDVFIDTHFSNRSRFVRMAQVIFTNPTCIGVGIGEDTAGVIHNGQEAEIIGSGLVFIIDGTQIGEADMDDFLEKKRISIRDLKVHLLSDGDVYTIPQNNPPHQ